jgi:hypothetical protein
MHDLHGADLCDGVAVLDGVPCLCVCRGAPTSEFVKRYYTRPYTPEELADRWSHEDEALLARWTEAPSTILQMPDKRYCWDCLHHEHLGTHCAGGVCCWCLRTHPCNCQNVHRGGPETFCRLAWDQARHQAEAEARRQQRAAECTEIMQTAWMAAAGYVIGRAIYTAHHHDLGQG